MYAEVTEHGKMRYNSSALAWNQDCAMGWTRMIMPFSLLTGGGGFWPLVVDRECRL